MNDNWIVILDVNTADEQVYCVNDTPYSVVQGWANQARKEKNQLPIIITQKILSVPENTITISVSYHAQFSYELPCKQRNNRKT